jgi:hypothetical protein
MHSHDPDKGYSFSEEFDRELRSIMDGSSIHNRAKNKWDFQGFVFFKAFFSHWSISPLAARIEINFARATFARGADFSYSSFDCDVDFKGAPALSGEVISRIPGSRTTFPSGGCHFRREQIFIRLHLQEEQTFRAQFFAARPISQERFFLVMLSSVALPSVKALTFQLVSKRTRISWARHSRAARSLTA